MGWVRNWALFRFSVLSFGRCCTLTDFLHPSLWSWWLRCDRLIFSFWACPVPTILWWSSWWCRVSASWGIGDGICCTAVERISGMRCWDCSFGVAFFYYDFVDDCFEGDGFGGKIWMGGKRHPLAMWREEKDGKRWGMECKVEIGWIWCFFVFLRRFNDSVYKYVVKVVFFVFFSLEMSKL